MNGKEKATLILSMLGPQLSSSVLRRLPDAHAKKLASAINNLPPPNPKTLPQFFGEIQAFVAEASVATISHPEEESMSVPAPVPEVPTKRPEDIKTINDLTPDMLWEALSQEKPQTVAFFIKNLSDDIRDALAALLPADRVKDLEQRSVFDHELSKVVFSELTAHVLRFWREKLDPDRAPDRVLAAS